MAIAALKTVPLPVSSESAFEALMTRAPEAANSKIARQFARPVVKEVVAGGAELVAANAGRWGLRGIFAWIFSNPVGIALAAGSLFPGDTAMREPDETPAAFTIIDKPPPTSSISQWLVEIYELGNMMQRLAQTRMLMELYKMYGLTSLADNARRELEDIYIQMSTIAAGYAVMGNSLKIKAQEMSATTSVAEGDIVQNLPIHPSEKLRAEMNAQTYKKLDAIAPSIRGEMGVSTHRFIELMNQLVRHFASHAQHVGTDNIPSSGPVIVAPNHPMPPADLYSLTLEILRRYPERPWARLSLTGSLTNIYPQWSSDPHFTDHLITVERSGDPNKPFKDGRRVITQAIDFLRHNADGILYISPEGPDAARQNRISNPYSGFAIIAAATNAAVVPVLITGIADLIELTYDINGRILPPLANTDDPLIMIQNWKKALLEALGRRPTS